MNEIEAMRIFSRVAELASFTKAAQDLNLPNASVSSSVQQLEEFMGTRLLHRTTRKVQLTQDGQIFYTRSKDILSQMDELQSLFKTGPADLHGILRVDMPSSFAHDLVIAKLSEFLNKHPNLQIELSSADRRVDVVSEGFDCVIRIGKLQDSTLIARSLGKLKMVNCASPSYIKRYGMPGSLKELSDHRLVHYEQNLGSKTSRWEWFDGKKTEYIAMPGVITVNNTETYESACLAGLGIIQVPEIGLYDLIKQGLLVEVLPEYRAEPMSISLVYANKRNIPLRVQTFMDWLTTIVQPYTT